MNKEAERLDLVASRVNYSDGVNGAMISYCTRIFQRFYAGGRVLELGPAEGLSTQHLKEFCDDLEVCEGSASHATSLRSRYPDLTIHCCLFEDFEPKKPFSYIYLSHVLEHVSDPIEVLQRASRWLTSSGIIFASTPNARSFHRMAGVLAGDLSSPEDLNQSDLLAGHRRVFDRQQLHSLFIEAGFRITASGGFFLKSLSNTQLGNAVDVTHLEALMNLGEFFPENAGDIYLVASLAQQRLNSQ